MPSTKKAKAPAKSKPSPSAPAKPIPAPDSPAAFSQTGSDPEPRYNWPKLLSLVPKPSQEDLADHAVHTPVADLVADGACIRSDRILKDVLRWTGTVHDFWEESAQEVREQVVGYDPGLLRVLVWEGAKLRDMLETFTHAKDDAAASQAVAASMARQIKTQASGTREQLRAALQSAARQDAKVLPRILSAYGTAGSLKDLADSIHALAQVARSLLGDDSAFASKLRKGHVTEEKLKAVEAISQQVRSLGEKTTGGQTRTSVTQAQLDVQDGTCLELMEVLMDLLNSSHEINPAIPRLVPLATRSYFGVRRNKASPVAEAPPVPIPTT